MIKKTLSSMFLLFFAGCVGTSLNVNVKRPAELGTMKDYNTVVIEAIEYQEDSLSSLLRKAVPFLPRGETAIGATRLHNELLSTLRLSKQFKVLPNTELIKDEQEKIALVSAEIISYHFLESLSYRIENRKPILFGKDGEKKTKIWTCKGSAVVKVNFHITDLHTQEVLADRKFTKTETESVEGIWHDREPRFSDSKRSTLFIKCRERIVRSFMRLVTPYTEQVRVSFETDRKIPELKNSFTMVKNGSWDAAIEVLQNAAQVHDRSPLAHKIYYNLGLCFLYTDQFERAREALQTAHERKSSKKYMQAIHELEVRMEDRRQLEETEEASVQEEQ